jgi:4-hydroxy-tetrahydrodipicolinate synthase
MIRGSYVALVTPFKHHEIDYPALERLLQFHLDNGTDGLVIIGTTGEAPTLASDEKTNLIRFCVKKVEKRIPIMVGTGTNNLHHTISATEKARELGADAALVVVPYYNKPSQEGMYQFFKRVEAETSISLMLYNIPGRTGVNMEPETILRLAKDCPRIIGVKEASANLVQAMRILHGAPEEFSLMSGEDLLNLPLMSVGAQGTISVTANVVPRLMSDLIRLCRENRYDEARKLNDQLLDLNRRMFIDTNPIPVKEALAMMGMIELEMRLPLYYLNDDNRQTLRDCLKSYRLI